MDKKLEKLKDQQNEAFSSIADILTGISSPTRVKLIHFLSQGPLTVEVLAFKIDQSIANTSMHLRKMLQAQIVTVTVMGKNRLYSVHPAAFSFWEACQDFAQTINPTLHLDVKDIYGEINWKENLKTTVKMAKNNQVTIVDARPSDEISESITGIEILNIPSSEINKNLSRLNKKKPTLVFCRGRLCALSAYTVKEMRKHGLNAYRLNESWYSIKSMIK